MVRNMKKFKTLALAAAISAGLLGSAGVMAATQGELSDTRSEGTFDITFFNETQIILYGLEDIDLFSTSPSVSGDEFKYTPVCVASNIGSSDTDVDDNKYEIALSSDQDFKLESGESGLGNIPYKLTVVDTGVPKGTWGDGGAVDNGAYDDTALQVDSLLVNEPPACNSTDSVDRVIRVDLVDALAAAAGVYSDTVTVTVAPL